MKTYFSSDFHLDHKNIIDYDGRPFKSIEEMNETIIENHNAIVTDEDEFYFLGDFSFAEKDKTKWFLQRLKGTKFFIKGNHDHKDSRKLFNSHGIYLGEQAEVTINGQGIVLNHYSMRVWNKSHHGAWHLYGHSHGTLPDDPNSLSFDVGTMLHGYKPLEFEQVKAIMAKKDYKPKDHHRPENKR